MDDKTMKTTTHQSPAYPLSIGIATKVLTAYKVRAPARASMPAIAALDDESIAKYASVKDSTRRPFSIAKRDGR